MKKLGSILILAVLATGCAQQTATKAKADLRLYPLQCGGFKSSDMSSFSGGGEYDGQTGELTISCFLIRHAKGDLMWDSGLPDALVEQPNGLDVGPMHMWVERTLRSQVEALGLTAADIDYLALSHAHFDHSGNANLFAGATWLVDPVERTWMFSAEEKFGVDPKNYSSLEGAKTIDVSADYDVFGDGSVIVVRTPGHTPGHLALLVHLPNSGPILLTGDLYHLRASRTHKRVPGFNFDPKATLASMEKFEKLAQETGARVIIQHVPEDIATLPSFPAYLD